MRVVTVVVAALTVLVASAVGSSASVARAAEASGVAPEVDVLALSSLPGAALTLHLDVLGGELRGTDFNDRHGLDVLEVPPFSVDGDPALSADERALVHRTWASLAEDFAPFAVNVTTARPPADALHRSSQDDGRYGLRVVLTQDMVVDAACHCGGAATFDAFGAVGSASTWGGTVLVFSNGGPHGGLGATAAHEVGHTLGLLHDGRDGSAYHDGAGGWAPIMGAPWEAPLTQWSAGEYAGATTRQDDLALIAARIPLRADEPWGLQLDPGDGAQHGVVTTRRDVDAWTVVGTGRTATVTASTATPTGGRDPNLDLALTLRRPGAAPVVVDPAGVADATWRGRVPAGEVWTVEVDGVGHGDPRAPGGYSDYGSVGTYAVSVSGVADAPGFRPVLPELPVLTGGSTWTSAPTTTTSTGDGAAGTSPYVFRAAGLPAGLTMAGDGRISGTPSEGGTFGFTVAATDATGAVASVAGHVTVRFPAPVVTSTALPQARTGVPYTARLQAGSGDGRYTWRAVGGLPPGLVVASDGTLSGTTRAAGTWPLVVAVRSGGVETRRSLPLTVAAPVALPASRVLAPARVGQPWTASFRITGGVPAFRWGYRNVPPGMSVSLTPSRTALTLAGRPTRAGTWHVVVAVADGGGTRSERVYTVTVR